MDNELFLPTFRTILNNATVKIDSSVAWKSTRVYLSDICVHVLLYVCLSVYYWICALYEFCDNNNNNNNTVWFANANRLDMTISKDRIEHRIGLQPAHVKMRLVICSDHKSDEINSNPIQIKSYSSKSSSLIESTCVIQSWYKSNHDFDLPITGTFLECMSPLLLVPPHQICLSIAQSSSLYTRLKISHNHSHFVTSVLPSLQQGC